MKKNINKLKRLYLESEEIMPSGRVWICYDNLPCVRRMSGFTRLKRERDRIAVEADGHIRIKRIYCEDIDARDAFNDIGIRAWNERRNWKRNSKRRRQWKVKE